jgi:prepilin-type processing-associated H-X9-DG protein
MRRSAFTRVELVVVSVMVVLGIAYALALIGSPRIHEGAPRVKCASNLRQIGQAILLYANENHGYYPRTVYAVDSSGIAIPVSGTAPTAVDPFADSGPQPNDVTAALFLLLRTEDITAEVFTCPNSNADRDDFGRATTQASGRSNFTDWRKNLSYSFNNPYPNRGAISDADQKTWMTASMSADFAVASDLNPGTFGGRDVTAVDLKSPSSAMRKANSTNHEGDGQNVLYGDGHVEFQNNPLCGVNRDNIFTSGTGKVNASPIDASDSVLLPAQDW